MQVFFITIAFACYRVQKEAEKIPSKFEMLWEKGEIDEQLKKDLYFFCNFLYHNKPIFSAVGIVSISRDTISDILATSVNFIIADIQMRATI